MQGILAWPGSPLWSCFPKASEIECSKLFKCLTFSEISFKNAGIVQASNGTLCHHCIMVDHHLRALKHLNNCFQSQDVL